jgi:hypothetical protein
MTCWARLLLIALLAGGVGVPMRLALAQQRQGARDTSEQGSSPGVVQVGAGTDNETTTAFSGPQQAPKGEPPLPQASLCDSYQGRVRQACLATVLRSNGG